MGVIQVVVVAMAVTTLAAVVGQLVYNYRGKEREEVMAEVKKYRELSEDAYDMGDRDAYNNLNKRGNEALMKLFVNIYLEAISEICLHVLAIGILQQIFGPHLFIKFPVAIMAWKGIGSTGLYLFSAVAFHFKVIKPAKRKIPFFKEYKQAQEEEEQQQQHQGEQQFSETPSLDE
ncbi:MAG TPA: hypothetical protein VFD15_00030 [Clostridia bacterium]|nr:hypothetical protein [Clostridia bacterium]